MHNQHINDLKVFVEERNELLESIAQSKSVDVAVSLPKDKKLDIMCCFIHAADISNPVKSRPVMLSWTEKVLVEFWSQGDEERALGLAISPLCDRTGANVPQG